MSWSECYIESWYLVAKKIMGRRNVGISVAASCSARGRQFFITVPELGYSTLRETPEAALMDLLAEFGSRTRLSVVGHTPQSLATIRGFRIEKVVDTMRVSPILKVL